LYCSHLNFFKKESIFIFYLFQFY